MEENRLKPGLSASSSMAVTAEHTAAAMGSGDMRVLATPALVALMENAAMQAVAAALPEGATTVGAEIACSHVKPSGLGAVVTATAVVASTEGRKIIFNIGAVDGEGLIGEATHVRYVVDRARFMERVK